MPPALTALQSASSAPSLPQAQWRVCDTIVTRDLRSDFMPLPFRGFISTGHCFLRVDIHAGKFTVLCSQLPGYTGTAVTNAVEAIIDSLLHQLMTGEHMEGGAALQVQPSWRWLRRLLRSRQHQRTEALASARRYFLRNVLWIEHYPRVATDAERETHAVVSFTPEGAPSWHYLPRERILEQLGDPAFLDVDPQMLAAWAPR